MTAKLPIRKIATIILSSFIVLSLFQFQAIAQEAEVEENSTQGAGIQVSSPVYNFAVDPGKNVQEIVKIRNVGTTRETFYPEVLDFKSLGESGAPQFLEKEESENYSYSLSSWVNISTEPIVLEPNQSTALNFVINVPANAEPGGRYAGILFGTTPPEQTGTGVAVSNKVGALLLVRVSGEAQESATIKSFNTNKGSYDKGPVEFELKVENSGNVHIVPKGTIEVKNMFGQTSAKLDINQVAGNVLPGGIRTFDKANGLVWEAEGLNIGMYTAKVLITYGNGKTLSAEKTFWIIPWVQLTIWALITIVILLLLFFGFKRYNRYIVSRALKNQKTTDTPPSESK